VGNSGAAEGGSPNVGPGSDCAAAPKLSPKEPTATAQQINERVTNETVQMLA
jgi:hypothetical protein